MSKALFDRCFPGEWNNLAGLLDEVVRVSPAQGTILDLGCGANYHLARFRTAERQVWGVDFAPHPALQHAAWFRTLNADGTIPFADGTFDVVSTNMVLEHVADPAAFLAEVRRVLKPGGMFLGHTISSLHYVTLARRALDILPHGWVQRLVQRLYGREEHDTFPTCYRLNTPARIARVASPLGFELVRTRRYANPGYFAFSAVLCRGAILADWLLERIKPGMGRIYFTAVFRKEGEATSTFMGRAA